MTLVSRRIGALLLALLLMNVQAAAPVEPPHWAASWAAAPQRYGQMAPFVPAAPVPPATLADLSLRQELRPSLAGQRIRIRFSNQFGRQPLHIAAASVARSSGGAVVAPATLKPLRFGGRADVTIAAGAQAWSDDTRFEVDAAQPVSVSFRIDAPTPFATVHQHPPGATWTVPGDAVLQAAWNAATPSPWNHIVTGLDVAGSGRARVVVAFGDSITAGAGAKEDRGLPVRYPELLAARLQGQAGAGFAVLNAGISGNRLLADWIGPKGIDRFRRDVLGQSGVTDVVILIGINDIGFSMPEGAGPTRGMPTAAQITEGLQRLVDEAQARGVKVMLGTLLPFKGSGYWSREKEARRQAVNDWIRHRRDVALADFDAALRDPEDPPSLNPVDDSGDHLHPGNAGYAAMADSIDLRAFEGR